MTDFATMLVPGLLQTMEYAEAIMRIGGVPDPEIGDRVVARKRRQERLQEVDYAAFIHEAALRNVVGGENRVMRGQHRHLVDMIREGYQIRVVPTEARAHPGLSVPFMLLRFTDRTPTVHVELAMSDAFLADVTEVSYYSAMVERLSVLALDTSNSVHRIEQIAEKR
ncbi:DUF5753 domain-containing protein [Actinokineospora sp.]|uniref:DUF5753 domain-containing protein n=1 Tax=Actinokineospora sp. TaxID=1872133 RepID=UPI003D6AB7A0